MKTLILIAVLFVALVYTDSVPVMVPFEQVGVTADGTPILEMTGEMNPKDMADDYEGFQNERFFFGSWLTLPGLNITKG